MNKYKISVYAICKNEEKNIIKWYNSMKEADNIYVLDTGSTDNSVNILKSLGVTVKQEIINPWRFDVARNKSLDMVSKDTDICVCTDLDEVFEPLWREKIEKYWDSKTTLGFYNYNWLLDEDNNPKVSFYIEKIHNRFDYIWTYPVHEVLTYIGDTKENKTLIEEITLNHYQDKAKSRASYLPLLISSAKENPNDDRIMHYLGREYMYHKSWNKSIETLLKHLSMPSSTWKDERSASMRYISRCYKALNNIPQAKIWLEKSINETPYLKEPYAEYGILEYELNNYDDAIIYLSKAQKITKKYKTYMNEEFCNDSTIDDILSVCYYNIKDYKNSIYHVIKAIKLDNKSERLKENMKIIIDSI